MADQSTRQHYRVATGGGLSPAPPSKPNPGYKKGGKVSAKKYMKGGSTKRGC